MSEIFSRAFRNKQSGESAIDAVMPAYSPPGSPDSIAHGRTCLGTGATGIDRVVVINDFSALNGGCASLALLSARLFRQLGIPVTFLCGDAGATAELDALGIETVSLGSEDIFTAARRRAVASGLHNSAAKELIANWIEKNDSSFTIYHVHGWAKIMSPAIFLALAPVAGRTVLHAHDFFLLCPNGSLYDYSSQSLCNRQPLSLACIASNCDKRNYAHKLWRVARSTRLQSILLHKKKPPPFSHIFLPHEKMAPAFKRSGYPSELLHTLRNPVSPYTKERVRVEDQSEFFFIGQLDSGKGVEDAIEAAILAGVRLTIIGDGPLKEQLRGRHPNISVVGWQTHSEIAGRIRAARGLLMPSRFAEPFGLVAVEASQSGIPVILSNRAYLANEMDAGGIGIACDTSDVVEFAAALRRLAEMPRNKIRMMSERAYSRNVSLATAPEEWRDALIEHYRSLVTR